jgi:hypothetical protein
MTTDERTKTVEIFQSDKSARVLLISMVGSIGLNLTMASIVICFVSCPFCCHLTTNCVLSDRMLHGLLWQQSRLLVVHTAMVNSKQLLFTS